jgi:hypothetical protein
MRALNRGIMSRRSRRSQVRSRGDESRAIRGFRKV